MRECKYLWATMQIFPLNSGLLQDTCKQFHLFSQQWYKSFNYNMLFIVYRILTFILILILFLGYFPACYIEPQGLTPFKKISEYIIIVILGLSIYNLYRYRAQFESRILNFIISAILMTIISEIFFTSYISVYGIENFIGHIFKIVAFI